MRSWNPSASARNARLGLVIGAAAVSYILATVVFLVVY